MGATGKWQAIVCAAVALTKTIGVWNVLINLFLTPKTEYRCIRFKNNVTIDAVNSTCYDECVEYEYYQDVFEETLISEFGLICEHAWMASFTQTVFMFGLSFGITIFGWISDRFGRRNAMIISCSVNVAFMIGSSYALNYWTLTALRFIVGIASGGIQSIVAVYILEIVGPQYRELAGGISVLPVGVAECTLAGFAYFSPTWQIYLRGIGIASLIISVVVLFIPETPRWLVTNGKADRAIKVMTNAASLNNRNTSDIRDNVTKTLLELNVKTTTQHINYTDLFQTKKLTVITLSSLAIWFVTGVCYYGMNQYISLVSSNVFVIVAIMGAIQIPLALLSSVITKIFGRRASAIGTYIICGFSMICLIFISVDTWISTAFGVLGTASSFLNIAVLYLYVSELYPTAMRNMGFSVSAAGSKFGATIAPFVANSKPQWIATCIFAVLPLIAAAICLLLPETKGQKLRDTVEEDDILQPI